MIGGKALLLLREDRSTVIPSRPNRYAVALRASLDQMPPPRQGLRKQVRQEVSAGAPLPTAGAAQLEVSTLAEQVIFSYYRQYNY